jgi:hypothetical protein
MSASASVMQITIEARGPSLRERLRDRLERTARLRCPEHGQTVIAVTIHDRENGWFDATWTTCCPSLEQQAAAVLKDRL